MEELLGWVHAHEPQHHESKVGPTIEMLEQSGSDLVLIVRMLDHRERTSYSSGCQRSVYFVQAVQ